GGLVVTEDDVAEHRGGGVVHVHGRAFGADEGAHGAFDEVTSGLGEHGDDDVIGNGVVVDDGTHEVEIGLRRGGETDLDLLVAHLHEEVEHFPFAGRVH